MRFVATALCRAQMPTQLASRTWGDPSRYHEAAKKASLAFANIILGNNNLDVLRSDLFDKAIVRRAELTQQYGDYADGFGQSIALIVSRAGGAIGIDMKNFSQMFLTSPPKHEGQLTQLLGRIRRLQGALSRRGAPRRLPRGLRPDDTRPPGQGAHRGFQVPWRCP